MDASDDITKELEAILYSLKDIDPLYLEPCGTVNDISIPNSHPETIASNLIGASCEGVYFDFDDFESEKLHSVPSGLPETCFMLYDPRSSSEIVYFENLCGYDTNDNETEKPRAKEGPFEAASQTKSRGKYFTKREASLLESCFFEDPEPPFKIRKLIAEAFGTTETRIKSWFHKTKLKRKIQSKRKEIPQSNKTQNQPDEDGCSFVRNVGNDYLLVGGTIWKDISTDSRQSQYNLGSIHRVFQFSDDTLSYHSRLHLHGSTLQEANTGNSNPEIQGEVQVPGWGQELAEMGKATYYDIAQNSNLDSSWDIVDENFDPCNERGCI